MVSVMWVFVGCGEMKEKRLFSSIFMLPVTGEEVVIVAGIKGSDFGSGWSQIMHYGDFNSILSSEERKGIASEINLEGMSEF